MKSNKPLISILMPLYNSEKYVEEAILSVLHQTYSNWELLIVNDGSIDFSLEIVKKYAKFDRRIRVESQLNSGPANTKNKLIQLFNGDYAIFLDSDDLIDQNLLKILVNQINTKNNDFILYSFYKFNNDKKVVTVRRESSLDVDLMYTAVWNKLYSKHILKKLVFPANTVYEDVAFSAMAVLISKEPGIISKNDLLYGYRENNTSITNNTKQNVERHLDIIEDFKRLMIFIEEEKIILTANQLLQVEALINTVIFSHCLQVAELPILRNKKSFIISKLLDYQKSVIGNNVIYSRKRVLNIKQKIFMFLIRAKLFALVAALDKSITSVRKLKNYMAI